MQTEGEGVGTGTGEFNVKGGEDGKAEGAGKFSIF